MQHLPIQISTQVHMCVYIYLYVPISLYLLFFSLFDVLKDSVFKVS